MAVVNIFKGYRQFILPNIPKVWFIWCFFIIKFRLYILGKNTTEVGLPRWLSGKESTCQCRRHRRRVYIIYNNLLFSRQTFSWQFLSLCKTLLWGSLICLFIHTWIGDGNRGRDGGMNWEIGVDIYTLLCIKDITIENLMYSSGNCTQCSVVT